MDDVNTSAVDEAIDKVVKILNPLDEYDRASIFEAAALNLGLDIDVYTDND